VRRIHASVLLGLALTCTFAGRAWAAEPFEKHPGYVDCSMLQGLGGDDAGSVEVTLHGALLKALLSVDPELKQLAGGLQSIHAVVVDLGQDRADLFEKGRAQLLRAEKSLVGRGWERITKIQDSGANVSVLVLSDEEKIDGLVVLVAGEDGELVCANIAGDVDLAAIAKLGEKLDIPGLDDLKDE
jgi:hypothetical protein